MTNKSILQGVVKDHRIPMDYKMSFTQPVTSRRFYADFKKQIAQRFITKQYAAVPMFMLFCIGVPYFFL